RVQGRYRIVRALGTGAFGSVCLAEDESTGHQVAIRLLPRWLAAPPHAAQAVLRRGRSIIAASAAHPGLVRVHEFGELETGGIFAAMEFVEGRRLSEILSGGEPLDISAAIRLALDLGGSVETLHNMGLVHGALRPCNVLVLEDGRVKLMDLELAGLRDARPTGAALAASLVVVVAWSLLALRPSEPRPLAQPAAPPPTSAQAPGSSPPTSSARAAAPPPATTTAPAKPAAAPSPAAKATPPSAPLAVAPAPPAVAPSPAAKATPPSASPLAAAPAKPAVASSPAAKATPPSAPLAVAPAPPAVAPSPAAKATPPSASPLAAAPAKP